MTTDTFPVQPRYRISHWVWTALWSLPVNANGYSLRFTGARGILGRPCKNLKDSTRTRASASRRRWCANSR